MIKLVGALMAALTIALIGIDKTHKLALKVTHLEKLCSMLKYMADLIKNNLPTLDKILKEIGDNQYYKVIDFIPNAEKLIRSGESFKESWKKSILESEMQIDEADRNLIISLGEILGRFDGESQEKELLNVARLLNIRLDEAREKKRNFSPIYKTIGICGSLAVFILLI
ncbi:MAG: stage III sporulation protein AB [Oscillospiraceae bacterium]